MLSKMLSGIIKNNVSLYPAPNEYVLHQSKHIPEGKIALMNKLDEIVKFSKRNYGECHVVKEPQIKGNKWQLVFYMVCAHYPNNEFENAVPTK